MSHFRSVLVGGHYLDFSGYSLHVEILHQSFPGLTEGIETFLALTVVPQPKVWVVGWVLTFPFHLNNLDWVEIMVRL